MTKVICKGDSIQPITGRKLRDARAESHPFMGYFAGDSEPRLLIHWSYQASDNDRHRCIGVADCFERIGA